MIRKRSCGFTLTEIAIAFLIVSFLLASAMYTLSAQTDQRNRSETLRRLEEARELVLTFAVVNGRLPCPARSNSSGDEVRNAAGECKNAAAVEDYYGGTLSDGATGGLLPATTIGFAPVDSSGFGLDAWGNRIRYAVAKAVDTGVSSCPDTATTVHFTLTTKLKTNGITCTPGDLIVCNATQAIAVGTACNSGTAVTNRYTVVAVVLSTGKNGALGTQGTNESENVDGDHLFVYRTPDPSSAATGAFDDLVAWVPVGLFYGRLIAAGVLP